MSACQTFEDYLRGQVEKGQYGVAIIQARIALDIADYIEKHRRFTIEPKKGKWIEDAETFYKAVNEKGGGVDADTPYFTEDDIACSECLTLFSVIDNCTECFNFCPNCGARMEN